MTAKKDIPFEKAYIRLEEILKAMNEPQTTLEDSLKLFEEADSLIQNCNHKLKAAEQKIEILIKNRDGSAAVDSEGSPLKEPLSLQSTGAF